MISCNKDCGEGGTEPRRKRAPEAGIRPTNPLTPSAAKGQSPRPKDSTFAGCLSKRTKRNPTRNKEYSQA